MWPRSVAGRLGLALALAAGGITALAIGVQHADAAQETRVQEREPRPIPMGAPTIPFPLAPVAGRIRLAAQVQSVAPECAPVVQILADGSARLLRQATEPAGVDPAPPAAVDAAIVLPGRSLRQIDPVVRSTLVEILSRLTNERPVPMTRIVSVDVAVAQRDVTAVLEWIR